LRRSVPWWNPQQRQLAEVGVGLDLEDVGEHVPVGVG
jgi:hypothetical protein